MKALLFSAGLLCCATSAFAVECTSVGAHLSGQPIVLNRRVQLKGSTLLIQSIGETRTPVRRVTGCKRLASGLLCATNFHGAEVTIMTNGRRMIERVTAPDTGQELAAGAYECNGAL